MFQFRPEGLLLIWAAAKGTELFRKMMMRDWHGLGAIGNDLAQSRQCAVGYKEHFLLLELIPQVRRI